MFDNLTKEIIILSLIPILIIGIIDLIVFLIMKRKYRNYRFNYFFKLSSIIAISMVLSLISGYTIWIFKSFGKRGIIGSNIWYLLLLVFLWIYLLIMLIVMYVRLMKNANEDEKIDKIVEKNPEIKIWEVDKSDIDEDNSEKNE